MPYDEKQEERPKPRKRKRDTISFRLPPERKEMLDRAGMPYDEKQKEPLKPRKRKRDTISFRLLPETKEMLDRAASETDMTLGRYIEKALRAQFRKDGIVPAKQLEKMEQVLLYKSLVETELAKGKQVELSVLIDGELYALRRRDTIREQDKTIKSARKLRGARDYKLVHIAKAFERTDVYVGLSKSPRLAAELAWDPKPPDIVVGPSKPGSPSLVVDLKNSEGASHRS